jgi:hypothetical protein
MISFIGKVVETPTYIPGKRVGVKVVWKGDRFIGRIDKEIYEIEGWNDLTNCKWVYTLPNNTYYPPWRKRPYMPPVEPDPDVLAMTLRFYGKYWNGMTIYGKIVDGVFIEIKHRDEPVISEAITEQISDATIHTVL